MNFLLWTFGIFFGIYLTFRLFGRQILRFGLNKLMKKIVQDAEKQAMHYERVYDDGNFRKNVYVDNEIKVSAPKENGKREVSVEEIAEEVEFEEIK